MVYYVDMNDEPTLDALLKDNPTEIDVELRDLKEVLAEAVVDDHVAARVEEKDGAFVVHIARFLSDRLLGQIRAFNEKQGLPKQASLYDGEEDADEVEAEAAPAKRKKRFTPITVSDEGLELIEAVSVDATNAEGAWTSDAEVRIDKKGHAVRDGVKTEGILDGTITSAKRPLRLRVRNIAGDEAVVVLS